MPYYPARFLALLLVIAFALPAASQSPAAPALSPELQRVRAALEKYQDPVVAVHDGYLSTVGCAEFPNPAPAGHEPYPPGAMGVHFLNPQLVGPVPDPMHPPILLYEPVGDKLRLVGAEWFIPLATGVKNRPQLFGQRFWGPMEGHHPLMPLTMHHYDLHVWLFKDNPRGMFVPTNAAVHCAGYGYAMPMEAPKPVPEPKP